MKNLAEVFDINQLKVIEMGGNHSFRSFIDTYEKDKERDFPMLYRCDAAIYYTKVLHFKIKNVEFTERAPPRNDTDRALYAAKDTLDATNKAVGATAQYIGQKNEEYKVTQSASDAIKKIDEQYNISKTASDAAAKAKSSIMGGFGLFGKKKAEEPKAEEKPANTMK